MDIPPAGAKTGIRLVSDLAEDAQGAITRVLDHSLPADRVELSAQQVAKENARVPFHTRFFRFIGRVISKPFRMLNDVINKLACRFFSEQMSMTFKHTFDNLEELETYVSKNGGPKAAAALEKYKAALEKLTCKEGVTPANLKAFEAAKNELNHSGLDPEQLRKIAFSIGQKAYRGMIRHTTIEAGHAAAELTPELETAAKGLTNESVLRQALAESGVSQTLEHLDLQDASELKQALEDAGVLNPELASKLENIGEEGVDINRHDLLLAYAKGLAKYIKAGDQAGLIAWKNQGIAYCIPGFFDPAEQRKIFDALAKASNLSLEDFGRATGTNGIVDSFGRVEDEATSSTAHAATARVADEGGVIDSKVLQALDELKLQGDVDAKARELAKAVKAAGKKTTGSREIFQAKTNLENAIRAQFPDNQLLHAEGVPLYFKILEACGIPVK